MPSIKEYQRGFSQLNDANYNDFMRGGILYDPAQTDVGETLPWVKAAKSGVLGSFIYDEISNPLLDWRGATTSPGTRTC